MTTSIVLTVIGDDRPGIVEALSKLVAAHEGNWSESSMLSLAGKFAGILRARLPSARAAEFVAALDALRALGLQVVAEQSEAGAAAEDSPCVNIELVGLDRPGIVRDITQVLLKYGINVEELDTACESASMSGEELFIANARVRIPAQADIEALQQDLERLANELMVDITWEED